MPPHLLVPNLRNQAAQVVVNDLVDFITLDCESCQCENYYDMEMQMKQLYLSSIPATICEDILLSILSCANLNVLERFRALQLLLCSSTKCLVIGAVPDLYHSQVLSVIATQGAGLTNLDLRGMWVKEENDGNLCDVLKQLPLLTVLRIPHMATDNILDTIGQYNTDLRILDISGESLFTRQGVESFCAAAHNSSLELVSVGRPCDDVFLEPETVSLFIRHLPKLSSLGSYSHVGRAVSCVPEEICCETGLQYVHDTCTDVVMIQTIIRRCPRLTSVYLDRPEDGVVPLLGSMASLSEIKLSRFQCADVEKLIRKGGAKILTLNLVIGHGILDISKVAVHCSELRTLQCYKLEHIVYFEENPFLCLKKLDIFYSTLSTTCLRYLVSSSPMLEGICLYENSVNLSNSTISEVFLGKLYETIRSLRISNARMLSDVGLDMILSKCPNLTWLGYLETWGLSHNEIEELQVHVKKSNFDLKLEF